MTLFTVGQKRRKGDREWIIQTLQNHTSVTRLGENLLFGTILKHLAGIEGILSVDKILNLIWQK